MVVNGSTSEPVQVVSDVPQGSVLGRLLFIILYVNSLCNLNFSDSSGLVMDADDLALHKPIASEEDWINFQNDISAINKWVDENHLSFNASK